MTAMRNESAKCPRCESRWSSSRARRQRASVGGSDAAPDHYARPTRGTCLARGSRCRPPQLRIFRQRSHLGREAKYSRANMKW